MQWPSFSEGENKNLSLQFMISFFQLTRLKFIFPRDFLSVYRYGRFSFVPNQSIDHSSDPLHSSSAHNRSVTFFITQVTCGIVLDHSNGPLSRSGMHLCIFAPTIISPIKFTAIGFNFDGDTRDDYYSSGPRHSYRSLK